MSNNNNAMTDDRYRLMAPSVQHVNLQRLIQTYSLLSDKGAGTVDDVMGASNYRPLPNAPTESCVRAKPVVRKQKQFWTDEEDKLLLNLVQKYGHYGLW
jgi:hypothetical protein